MFDPLTLRTRSGLLGAWVRVLSSIWLGVSLLALIILYSAVGSAVPPFRQYFELTEFQYFNHWVFGSLIGLFCLCLVTTTLVRIRFNRFNAGVITTHTGLLLLAGGSVLYFGRKIEGDVLLWNPRVQVLSAQRLHGGATGSPVIGQVVAAGGRAWEANMPMLGGRTRVEVESVRNEGLTTAAEVAVRASTGDAGKPSRLTLKQDDPRGAFARLNDQLFLQLAPANVTDRFYDNNTAALLVRHKGRVVVFPLRGLPYYYERFMPSVEAIRDTNDQPVASQRLDLWRGIESWSMPLSMDFSGRVDMADWPVRLEIDGYLPYAGMDRQPIPGGDGLNPVAQVELAFGQHRHSDWLFGRVPRDATIDVPGAGTVEFRWLAANAKLPPEATRRLDGRHVLDVWIKDKNVRRQYDLVLGRKIAVEGTDYELEPQDLQPNWPLATPGFEGARTPIARVWVRTPTRGFQRSVLQRYPELSQDRDEAGKKLVEKGLVDDNIELRYFDASTPHFLLAAGPDMSPLVVYTAPGGDRSVETLPVGRTYSPPNGPSLTLGALIEKPRLDERPVVIPVENRRPQQGRQFSMIRLHATWNGGERRAWLPFEPYNEELVDQPPQWATVVVPDLGPIQCLYGRMPRPLPGRLTLERMDVEFYPGRSRPSGWTSHIRWEDPNTGTVHTGRAFLNNTARIGPWTLFQSSEASDHESFTILGVGNRDGVMTMLLGCALVAAGMCYAFYVKPILKRRMRDRLAAEARQDQPGEAARPGSRGERSRTPAGAVSALAVLLCLSTAARAVAAATPNPADGLRAIQDRLHLDALRTLMVQHDARYQTLEAWARDVVYTIHGSQRLYGLDPICGALELMLNRPAYDALPVIYVKDMPIRKHITSHPVRVPPEEAARMTRTGLVSADYLRDPDVNAIVDELSANMILKRAMDRFGAATSYYSSVLSLFDVVPSPRGGFDSPWHGMDALLSNLGMPASHVGVASADGVPGVSAEQARRVLNAFRELGQSWAKRDVDGVNRAIDALAATLPTLAAPGAYPALSQRRVEVFYHRMEAFTFGWAFYIVALFVSIWAVIAGWNWTRRLAVGLYVLAVLLHGAGLAMRWYIVGRIPVANMFESVVASAWVGVMLALVLELATKRRVFVLAGSFLGFLSLVLGKFVGGQITQIAPILDDIMLRIHTVLIISSYSIITLAFGVSVCYLAVAARQPKPAVARITLGAVGALGLCAYLGTQDVFHTLTAASSWSIVLIPLVFAVTGALLFLYAPGWLPRPAPALLAGANPPGAAIVGAPAAAAAMPRDREALLAAFDLSQMILVHMAAIALFVGLVLGAIWADYSWGRPWGWDPKEVFALVTWLFYAILIHARFVTPRKALWTAVLSCVGFAAMQFNWWVVNFYIVGLHSYA